MPQVADFDLLAARLTGGAYPPQAFRFVREGLDHTVRMFNREQGKSAPSPDQMHVDARQLCLGLRDYAINQYGRLARTVLRRWRIICTEDFGRIVYTMVEAGILLKTEDDHQDDFRAVYDFADVFEHVPVA